MTGVALVVAMAKNRVIGAAGALPWRISDDLKWFKKVTLGKPIIMGRKTFDSIGKPLPGRENIVVTRNRSWRHDGVRAVGDVAGAIAAAEASAAASGADEICIIGGAEIYRQALALANRIYLTRVDAEVSGDACFPALQDGEWRETAEGGCEAGAKNDYSCRFVILERLQDTQ